MKTTDWIVFDGGEKRVRATYGFEKIGDQEPYFSVTGECQRKAKPVWREEASCAIFPGEYDSHFPPEIQRLFRWHLATLSGGPMHYVANGVYWWGVAMGLDSHETVTPGKALEHFRHAIVLGAVEGERVGTEVENCLVADGLGRLKDGKRIVVTTINGRQILPTADFLRSWLTDRLPDLLAAFAADLAAAGYDAASSMGEKPARESDLDRVCAALGITADVAPGKHSANWPESTPYRVTLRLDKRKLTLPFYCGRDADEPTAADVLSCITSDARSGELSFEEFCAEFGGNTDSRKAEKTWRKCVALAPKLRRFLGDHFDIVAGASH